MIEVTFDEGRIGRRTDVEPQLFATRQGAADLPQAMYQFVRQHLASGEITITTYVGGTGDIVVGGFRTVSTFTWVERPDRQ